MDTTSQVLSNARETMSQTCNGKCFCGAVELTVTGEAVGSGETLPE